MPFNQELYVELRHKYLECKVIRNESWEEGAVPLRRRTEYAVFDRPCSDDLRAEIKHLDRVGDDVGVFNILVQFSLHRIALAYGAAPDIKYVSQRLVVASRRHLECMCTESEHQLTPVVKPVCELASCSIAGPCSSCAALVDEYPSKLLVFKLEKYGEEGDKEKAENALVLLANLEAVGQLEVSSCLQALSILRFSFEATDLCPCCRQLVRPPHPSLSGMGGSFQHRTSLIRMRRVEKATNECELLPSLKPRGIIRLLCFVAYSRPGRREWATRRLGARSLSPKPHRCAVVCL